MSAPSTLGIVFAGGGTGGHIQPNLAVAEELAAMRPERVRATFVVSERPIDRRVLEGEQIDGLVFDVVTIPAKPMVLKPWAFLRFVTSWGGSVRAGRSAIRTLRESCDAVVVVSTGGFVSPGVAQAARVERAPFVMVNLDAVPGKANRLMRRWAGTLLSSAAVDDARYERIPPIVRRRMLTPHARAEAGAHFELDADRKTLLVTGGSQGARSVNEFVLGAIRSLGDTFDRAQWQILHQCGPSGEAELVSRYAELGVRAHVAGYIPRMDLAFAASDACVCRGGAGAIADLWATRTPALVLPYPGHRDQHQKLNARELEQAGGVIVGTDSNQPEPNLHENLGALEKLLDDAERQRMSVAISRLGPADGAARVAERVLEISTHNRG